MKLDPVVFKAVQAKLGVCDDVNLFASRDNNQLDRYVAWKPEPRAWQLDASSFDCNDFSPHCFPLFCLIPRILQRLELTEAECTLIVPLWITQPWYTKLLHPLTDTPVLSPKTRNLMTHPLTGKAHQT